MFNYFKLFVLYTEFKHYNCNPSSRKFPTVVSEIKTQQLFLVDYRLQLAQDLVNSMVFERSHRVRAKDSDQNRNRSRIIACKFANFKDDHSRTGPPFEGNELFH